MGWCQWAWPKGWGGTITDGIAQDRLAAGYFALGQETSDANKAFVYSINPTWLFDRKMVEIQEPTSFVCVEEVGASPGQDCVQGVAFPETCGIASSSPACTGWTPGSGTNWELCGEDSSGCVYNTAPNDGSFLRDASLRKIFTRHLGGVNIGFADGHAMWINSEALLMKVATKDWTECPGAAEPNSQCGFAQKYPGQPSLY
jgi:prepilin-type processing-associated H-X9-DG protein